MSGVRVRFAPSPTGVLHIGGARTALFNWLFARGQKGTFVLRIEDTDSERSRPEFTDDITESLRWLGLDWDEGPGLGGPHGPYFQRERLDLYRTRLRELEAAGRAYPCWCTPDELDGRRKFAESRGIAYRYEGTCRDLSVSERAARADATHAWRFVMPRDGTTSFHDLIHGTLQFERTTLQDLVLVRSDGLPTYNFAAVVDDAAMLISHVLRGDDHLSNTPSQVELYRAIGAEPPVFAHFPMILGADRSKLSKRHGAVSVTEYRRQGFLPEAMINFLALLGWGYDDKQTVFSRDDLVAKFSIDRVSKGGAILDHEKLRWMNGTYLRQSDGAWVREACARRLVEAGFVTESEFAASKARIDAIIELDRERLRTLGDVVALVDYHFARVPEAASGALRSDGGGDSLPIADGRPVLQYAAADLARLLGDAKRREAVRGLVDELLRVAPFEAAALETAARAFATREAWKFGELVQPIRLALTGRLASPGLFHVMALLGEDSTRRRVSLALAAAAEGPAPA